MALVGINGRAYAGKDTFGDVFKRAGYIRISFADALKEATAIIANERVELFHTAEGKEGFSPVLATTRRVALQNIGNSVREALDPEIWIRRAMDAWDHSGRPNAVITDVRYPNEAETIRSWGGTVVRITRPDNVTGLVGEELNHISEQVLDEDLIDIEVLNDGTLGELEHEARKVLAYVTPASLLPSGAGTTNPFRAAR